MNASVASLGRYSKGLRKQNGEHLVNLCESNNFETPSLVSIQLLRISQNFISC